MVIPGSSTCEQAFEPGITGSEAPEDKSKRSREKNQAVPGDSNAAPRGMDTPRACRGDPVRAGVLRCVRVGHPEQIRAVTEEPALTRDRLTLSVHDRLAPVGAGNRTPLRRKTTSAHYVATLGVLPGREQLPHIEQPLTSNESPATWLFTKEWSGCRGLLCTCHGMRLARRPAQYAGNVKSSLITSHPVPALTSWLCGR